MEDSKGQAPERGTRTRAASASEAVQSGAAGVSDEEYEAIFGPANAGPAPGRRPKKAPALPDGVSQAEYEAALAMARGNHNIVAPGHAARRLMENMHITPALFAEQMKMTREELEAFFDGGPELTLEMATALRDLTGVTIAFWRAAERQYRHRLDKEARKLLGVR